MARVIALTALAALGLSGAPVHEPVHAGGRYHHITVTQRSDRDLTATGRPADAEWACSLTPTSVARRGERLGIVDQRY